MSTINRANIPWEGGTQILPVRKGSTEEARKAALAVCSLAGGDRVAAAEVLAMLGLTDTLRDTA